VPKGCGGGRALCRDCRGEVIICSVEEVIICSVEEQSRVKL
jgi:hypothetical protein